MKLSFFTAISIIAFATTFTSCTLSYGEKVEINSKSEVYIKEGATKEEAQSLGAFLLRNNYFDTITPKSVQLVHVKDTVVVKFVVNKDKIENDDQAIIGFRFFQTLIRDSVFAGKPTKLVLTDGGFDEIKTIREFTKEELEAESNTSTDSTDTEPATDSIKR